MNSKPSKPSRSILKIAVCAFAVSGLMIGCSTGGSDRSETMSNKGTTRVSEKKFKFRGTMVREENRGAYHIVSERGEKYHPLNLPSAYRKAGMAVQVYGETRGYSRGGSMRALHIIEISRAPQR